MLSLFPASRGFTPALLIAIVVTSVTAVAPSRSRSEEGATPTIRELFVPFEDLETVLESAGRRVFLTREQFDALVSQAQKTDDKPAPANVALLSAEYDAHVEEGRIRIRGTIHLDVLADGLHAVPLDLDRVGLQSALLDDEPAALGRPQSGTALLFVNGRGVHELVLEAVAPVQISAARQTVHFQLPAAATGRMELTVPGDVEMRSGAEVLDRSVDKAAGVTRFRLLPRPGMTTIELTLNNRFAAKQRVMVARNVVVHEITESYERLHLTTSIKVLHGSVEGIRFAVPDGFEITTVATAQLSRWAVNEERDQRILDIRLRRAETDTIVLHLSAERSSARTAPWQMPALRPLDVAGTVSIVGLLVEERLRLQSVEASGLIPVDTTTLTDILPRSVLQAAPGAPSVRPVAAYFAPRDDYRLVAHLDKPQPRVQVTSNVLLVVQDSNLEVRGGFSLLPSAEKIFQCNIAVEPGWQVTEVTSGDGKSLGFESYEENNATRIRVPLPQGVPPGQPYSIYFRATHIPDGWLDPWPSREMRFPQFRIIEATRDRGAVAVHVRDDLVVRPSTVEGLTPLDENKKAQFNLADVETSLAYRFDSRPFAATLLVERTSPRVTAETFSFLTIEPGSLRTHYEIVYNVDTARTRTLSFRLPVSTPGEVSIRGLDGVAIKEFINALDGQWRRWSVELAEPAQGRLRLEVTFQQRLEMSEGAPENVDQRLAVDLALPLVRADDVEYQTGAVAVEGSAELEIDLKTDARRVDVGELVDADYQPGRHLLAAYGFVGQPPAVSANVIRPAGYGLPSAIVQRSELVTSVSTSGVSQSVARFHLRTKAQFIEVQLPSDSTLWSVYLDDTPAKPQRDRDRMVISLPSVNEAALRDLQLAYETEAADIAMWGSVEVPAPRLRLRESSTAAGIELPVADLVWHLYLPTGYGLVDSRGTVYPSMEHAATRRELAEHVTPLQRLGKAFVASPSLMMAREAALGTEAFHEFEAYRDATTESAGKAMAGLDSSDGLAANRLEGREGEDEEVLADDATEPGPANKPMSQPALSLESPTAPPSDRPASSESKAPSQRAGGGKLWALAGLRSLKIDLAEQGEGFSFRSLGAEPVLAVTVVDQRRLDMVAWSAALMVVLVGLMLSRRSVRARGQYVVLVLVLATLMPLVTGWTGRAATLFDPAFYAALALIPLYLLVSLFRWVVSFLVPTGAPRAAIGLVAIGIASWGAPTLRAASPDEEAQLGPLTVKIVPPDRPVEVPEDAIIVPYDPDHGLAQPTTQKVIVPYEKYVELWNLAHPAETLEPAAPPAPYALAGAQWQTTLQDGEFLLVEGQIRVHVYVDGPHRVPLSLAGGVLTRAKLDGQPAQIQIVEPAPPGPQQAISQAVRRVASPDTKLFGLYMVGKGEKQLDLAVRFPLTRRGGWYVADGKIPAAPATRLALRVPQPRTELRIAGVSDRSSYETGATEETIETALHADGGLHIEWRPKVAQASVDRSLTVDSDALLDVQEDSVRLVWRLNLKFPLGQRDLFRLEVPDDYLVERVVGENVRGWELKDGVIHVTLLKAAKNEQQLTVHLSQRGSEESDRNRFSAPLVQVPDAALHEGRLTVRRSPLLELRVTQTEGLARTSLGSAAGDGVTEVDSPLGLRPFQAFRFARTPFRLELSAHPIQSRVTAEIQTVLRMAEFERSLETRVIVSAEHRPVYQVQLELPNELEVEHVAAPGVHEWSVEEAADRQQLTLFLHTGQMNEFSVVLRGSYGERGPREGAPLPRIVVRDASPQESTIVVQTDPSYDARVDGLENCETVLLRRTYGWLGEQQRALARVAIHCPAADYRGRVLLAKKTPRVSCQTVSNIRVTDRNFEETILLDFSVQDAGIREVVFLLPAGLRSARIHAPMLRDKTLESVDDSTVRVRLQLQDEVMGQFRVLIENDRLLTSERQSVPIPVVETGRTLRRFVSLESAGRDEVLIDEQRELEPLTREQSQWRLLVGVLGEAVTQAFLVQTSAESPRLVVRTRDREAVDTVGARIAFAQTSLVVDASGAYRGVQTYRVDNRIEQFLEIALPEGARLWTAHVAGQPVKPVAGTGDVVRIPLVKTAEGDQDYAVQLKYGGRIAAVSRWASVTFPLIRTVNVNVEESQVRLKLPETHRWFDFGGTMRRVEEEEDLIAGYVKYKTEQLQRMAEDVASANPFARVRAKQNLKKLAGELQEYQQLPAITDNKRLQDEVGSSSVMVQKAAELLEKQQREEGGSAVQFDNRARLNTYFERQSNGFSTNLVNEQASNFSAGTMRGERADLGSEEKALNPRGQIQRGWIDSNALSSDVMNAMTEEGTRVDIAGKTLGQGMPSWGRKTQPQKESSPDVSRIVGDKDLSKGLERQKREPSQGDPRSRVRRFEQRLQQQEAEQFGARNADAVDGRQPREAVTDRELRGRALERDRGQLDSLSGAFAGGRAAVVGQALVPQMENAQAALGQLAAPVPPKPTGLASLDVQFPSRGVEYRFTTPRGDIDIVARAIDATLLQRLIRLMWVLGLVVLVGAVFRIFRHRDLNDMIGRGAATTLIVVGLLLLVMGLVPALAAIAIVVGCVQHVRLPRKRRQSAEA